MESLCTRTVVLTLCLPKSKSFLGEMSTNAQRPARYWPCLLFGLFDYLSMLIFPLIRPLTNLTKTTNHTINIIILRLMEKMEMHLKIYILVI